MEMDNLLAVAIYGGQTDPEFAAEANSALPDPVGEMITKAQDDLSRARCTATLQLDEILGPRIDGDNKAPVRVPGTPVTFVKGTMGYKLGVVSVEEQIGEDGAKWLHGYNASGELVDARLVE